MKKPIVIALLAVSAFVWGAASPGVAAGDPCTTECAAERDWCMSQVPEPGGPRPWECLAEFKTCLAKCGGWALASPRSVRPGEGQGLQSQANSSR